MGFEKILQGLGSQSCTQTAASCCAYLILSFREANDYNYLWYQIEAMEAKKGAITPFDSGRVVLCTP